MMAVLHLIPWPHKLRNALYTCIYPPYPALHPRLRKEGGSPLACFEYRSIHNVLMQNLSDLAFLLKVSHAPFWSGFLKSLYA